MAFRSTALLSFALLARHAQALPLVLPHEQQPRTLQAGEKLLLNHSEETRLHYLVPTASNKTGEPFASLFGFSTPVPGGRISIGSDGVSVDTPLGGGSVGSDGVSVQSPYGGVSVGSGGLSVETGVNLPFAQAGINFNVGASGADVSYGSQTPLGGYSLSAGTTGVEATGNVNLLGIAGADGRIGCNAEGCHAAGDLFYNPDCAKWWLDAAQSKVEFDISNNPIRILTDAYDVLKGGAETVKSLMTTTETATCYASSFGAEFLYHPFSGAPDYIECLDNSCGAASSTKDPECSKPTPLENIMEPLCSAVLKTSVLESAKKAIAQLKSFETSCVADLLPNVMSFAKGIAIGFGLSFEVQNRQQAIEFGIAFDFAKDGYHVNRAKCYAAGGAGITTNTGASIGTGVSVVATRNSPGGGYGSGIDFELDICKVFGLPCKLKFASGISQAYESKADRTDQMKEMGECLAAAASTNPLSAFASLITPFYPEVNILDKCPSTIADFISRTSAVTLPISLAAGVSANIIPTAVTYKHTYMSRLVPMRSTRGGFFEERNVAVEHFPSWASEDQVLRASGDFNGDGKTDIALVKAGWTAIPIAFSRGDGSFFTTNIISNVGATFGGLSPGTQLVACDINGDGRDDLVLSGNADWDTIPVAFSNGKGGFWLTTFKVDDFAAHSAVSGQTLMCGDFNGDGLGDIAIDIVGQATGSSRIAFSIGGGKFKVVSKIVNDWGCEESDLKTVAGDFDGNGCADLVCVGLPSDQVKVAFGNCDGSFSVVKTIFNGGPFSTWSNTSHTMLVATDVNGDHMDDLVLNGPDGWASVPVAFSKGDGNFYVTNERHEHFPQWTIYEHTQLFAGDFNGDGKGDIATLGAKGGRKIGTGLSLSTYEFDGLEDLSGMKSQFAPPCTVLHVGKQAYSSVTMELHRDDVQCESTYDKTNWATDDLDGAEFSISQRGRKVTIRRSDAAAGWNFDLKIACCRPPPTMFHLSVCEACGRNWCMKIKKETDTLPSLFLQADQTLQLRGCHDVDSSWYSVRNPTNGGVYAVASLTGAYLEARKTIFYTSQCVFCNINWCAQPFDKSETDLTPYYQTASRTLQERGCAGVDSSWTATRNSANGAIYALTPWSSRKVMFHTLGCAYCGIWWCGSYEREQAGLHQYYDAISQTLQQRGCSGVDVTWTSARDSSNGAVYAIAPW